MLLVADDIFKCEVSKENLKKIIKISKDSRKQGISCIISFIQEASIFKNFNKYYDVEISKYVSIGNRVLKRPLGKIEKCKGMSILPEIKKHNYAISNVEGLCILIKNCEIQTKDKEIKIYIQFV